MKKWTRIKYLPVLPMGEDGRLATGSEKHIVLSRKAASEGMVLLKNEDKLLPLKPRNRVALFGKATADYVKGGGGSGDVTVRYVRQFWEAMEAKQAEGKLSVFEPLCRFYADHAAVELSEEKEPGETSEPAIPEELLTAAAESCDIAIISISRYSKEGRDRKGAPQDGDFYLSPAEEAVVRAVTEKFSKIVVVFNVGGMVDTSWCKDDPKIKSILLAWQGGMEGASAQADILCGDVCPSGKLTDTFASSFDDYPSSYNFYESDTYVEYTDDIFVGYRYFETIPGAAAKVNYPFGFGLSYTSFDVACVHTAVESMHFTATIRVTNTGSVAGKEVVQLYVAAPAGRIDIPALELRGFQKTKLLLPGESVELAITTDINDWASYDETMAAFLLPQGLYRIYVGNCIRSLEMIGTYHNHRETIVEQATNRCTPRKLTKRLQSDGTYIHLPTTEYDPVFDTSHWPPAPQGFAFEHILPDQRYINTPTADLPLEESFERVALGQISIEQFMDELSDDELLTLVGGTPAVGASHTCGIGGLPAHGIPGAMTADGPAGLRIRPGRGVYTTAWPVATLLACTWDPDLIFEVGQAGALEVKENNCAMWLAPGINIHRSPRSGRNFEYYSEDPYVTGVIATAMTQGIQSQNIGACVKHLCCHNRELNCWRSDSIVSERALREIYLKAFKMVIQSADPWSIMSSYNIMNGRKTSENPELLIGILREEWGYKGLVLSDWANGGEHYRELLAGNDVKMPSGSLKRLKKAMELGLICRKDLLPSVRRVLEYLLRLD